MRITVDHRELAQAPRDLLASVGRAPATLSGALSHLGNAVAKAEREEIARVFDRPTRWALQGVYVRTSAAAAARSQLIRMDLARGPVQPAAAQVPYIDVGLKDDRASSGGGIPAAYFLEAQIEGGRRRIKGFEKMLQASGHMPQGWRAVPGKFARIDAFGNMSRGQLIQIVSQLRVTPLSGTTRNKSTEGLARLKSELKQGGQYFALPNGRGKLPPGVYLAPLQANASTRFKKTDRFTYRQANQLRMVERQAPQPVLIFVRNTDYRQRYDFWGVAERTYNARAPQILGAVLDSINKG